MYSPKKVDLFLDEIGGRGAYLRVYVNFIRDKRVFRRLEGLRQTIGRQAGNIGNVKTVDNIRQRTVSFAMAQILARVAESLEIQPRKMRRGKRRKTGMCGGGMRMGICRLMGINRMRDLVPLKGGKRDDG